MDSNSDRSMQDLKPTVWVGKQGCTETMIGEIVAQLKKRKLIKVKWLQNTEVDPEAVAREAKATLVEVRGRTMVLREKGKSAGSPSVPAKLPVRTEAKMTAKEKARSMVKSPKKTSAVSVGTDRAPKGGTPKRPRQIGTMTRAKK